MASLGNYGGSALQKPSDDFSPIPAGVYNVEVIESDVVSTKSGNGTMVKITLRVLDGIYENRRIWSQINIENQSQQAQEIGQRQLSDLARACGYPAIPSETEEFHGIPIRANVKLTPGNGQYGPKNEVSRYLAYEAGQTPAPNQAQQRPTSHASPARAASNAPPPQQLGTRPAFLNRRAG